MPSRASRAPRCARSCAGAVARGRGSRSSRSSASARPSTFAQAEQPRVARQPLARVALACHTRPPLARGRWCSSPAPAAHCLWSIGTKGRSCRAGVDLARAPDLEVRVAVHLDPLRDPARQASDREQRREHVLRRADRVVDHARVEVDVRIELALDEVLVLQRDLLELLGDLEQLRVDAQLLEHVVAGLLDDLHARVEVLVDAVAEAHQPRRVVLVLGALDELARRDALVADPHQHLDHRLVGAAVAAAPRAR